MFSASGSSSSSRIRHQITEDSTIIGDSYVICDSSILNRGSSSSVMCPVLPATVTQPQTGRNGSEDSLSLAAKAAYGLPIVTAAGFWSPEKSSSPFCFSNSNSLF